MWHFSPCVPLHYANTMIAGCVQVLSWYPRVILFPNYLSSQQAQYFMSLASDKLQPSELGVADVPFHPASGRTDGRQVRNSHGVFLDRTSDPKGFLAWIEERIAAVTMIPPSHGEVGLVLFSLVYFEWSTGKED